MGILLGKMNTTRWMCNGRDHLDRMRLHLVRDNASRILPTRIYPGAVEHDGDTARWTVALHWGVL